MLCNFNLSHISTSLWRSDSVYPSSGLQNHICAASKYCLSLLFSTHVSLLDLRDVFMSCYIFLFCLPNVLLLFQCLYYMFVIYIPCHYILRSYSLDSWIPWPVQWFSLLSPFSVFRFHYHRFPRTLFLRWIISNYISWQHYLINVLRSVVHPLN